MRIVLVGTVAFSEACLRELVSLGADIAAVLTLAPERARFNADYADLRPAAQEAGIPVHQIEHINEASTLALLRELAPDVIFVFGWSQLVSPEVLALPRLGCVGTHPALLPRDRGRHPIVWQLVDGREQGGLTFFWLDEGADSGDILWQRPFTIALTDDAADVYAKTTAVARDGIRDFLPRLQAGDVPRAPQDDAQATYRRKRGDDDGELQWEGPAMTAYNLVRALARPYVGAHTWRDGRRVTVWRANPPPDDARLAGTPPGTVLAADGEGVVVQTADGALRLVEVEVEGGGALRPGDRLGTAA